MGFFQGSDTYSIDSKGRVSVPYWMRKEMTPEAKDTFILTKGFKKCIWAYPLDEWSKFQKILMNKNQFDEDNDYIISTMLMYAFEVKLDSQQRIMVPKRLWELAEIDIEISNKAFILGKIDHIELWNPNIYFEMINRRKEPYEVIAARVMSQKVMPQIDGAN